MDKPVHVEEVDASHRLNKKVECFVFCKLGRLVAIPNNVEQIALLNILQDQVNVVVVF